MMADRHGPHVVRDVSDLDGDALRDAIVSWSPARFRRSADEVAEVRRTDWGGLELLTSNGGQTRGTAAELADILAYRWKDWDCSR